MVECYLCKGKLRVTRDKHVYDEKLKKRYHFKCFAGICRVCDMPVYSKSKHKVIGSNIWHEKCYKAKHRHNPIKTISDASWKAMAAARKAAGVPKKLWREFEETYFERHPPKFEENPDRPTKEFWAKHYPGILKEAKKKFKSKKRAEEYARGATAQIWHHTMGPKKKAEYERIRRKRESRENPIRHLMFSGDKAPASIFPELMGKKYLIPEGWWIITDDLHNRKVLQEHGVAFTRYQRPSAAEIVKAYDEQEGRENPKRRTIEEEEAAIQFKRDFEDTDMEEGRYDLDDPDSDASIDREARRETQEQGESEFWQDAQQAFSKGTKAFEDWLKENVDTRMIDEVREKARRYFSKKNPTLVTPEMETDIIGAFKRVITGAGTQADKALVRMAREADVIMSTGPSVLLKHKNPDLKKCNTCRSPCEKVDENEGECCLCSIAAENCPTCERYLDEAETETEAMLEAREAAGSPPLREFEERYFKEHPHKSPQPRFNPEKLDYIIQDEFGTTFETGKGTSGEAEARALHYNKKYMRSFKVIYPKTESPEVKKAAQKATREMLKS